LSRGQEQGSGGEAENGLKNFVSHH